MKGSINVKSENIFPIIKKWLYSDRDIFARELVSNACDALTKHKKLAAIGELKSETEENYAVTVTVSAKNKYLSFEDNGVGMTADEVNKYINEVAFSGAEDFLKNYKGDAGGIIGHFGLGFYSAFMVAKKVIIDTLSYQDGAEAVKWTCDGSTEFTLEDGTRGRRGTAVTLFLSDDGREFANLGRIEDVLSKYCAYLPYPVTLKDADFKPSVKEKKDKAGEAVPAASYDGTTSINKDPLWIKTPKDCTEEQYKDFYRAMFRDYREPLFWIHLNVDYPFNLKGILYFPAADPRDMKNEGAIKLFNNQVYVADNIKDVIPEYLMLLRGVLDCPDMPLNVSRSFLQNDGYLIKIKSHITKKVSEKLKALKNNDYENYKKYWKTVNPFVKYGCMTDKDFYEKIKEAVIFKKCGVWSVECEVNDNQSSTPNSKLQTPSSEYFVLDEVIAKKTVYYVNSEDTMKLYAGFKGGDVILLDDLIDTHFIQFLEAENKDLKFVRVDSDIAMFQAAAGENGEIDEKTAADIKEKFAKALPDVKKIETAALKTDMPCVIMTAESARRMEAMSRIYGMDDRTGLFRDETLIINTKSPIIQRIARLCRECGVLSVECGVKDGIKISPDDLIRVCYNMARLQNNTLKTADADGFIKALLKVLG